MRRLITVLACTTAVAVLCTGRGIGAAEGPLAINSARISIDGTSNIHAYTASTATVRLTGADVGSGADGGVLDHVLRPGGLKAFAVTIPAASLTSAKGDIDKNMHKALKTQEHPEIRFRLAGLDGAEGSYRARGSLTIAGVEKEVALDLTVERKGDALAVTGTTDLLMTDYGVAPPKAMLGMLKTNPKVQVRIELLIAAA